jgi:hypothetical protein
MIANTSPRFLQNIDLEHLKVRGISIPSLTGIFYLSILLRTKRILIFPVGEKTGNGALAMEEEDKEYHFFLRKG